jgi:dipeptidyl aminopeptidase/acylaminoacyl peptidase
MDRISVRLFMLIGKSRLSGCYGRRRLLYCTGYTDPDKLAVGGWSYGGILTNYVITNKFKAALSGASEALFRANYGHDHYQLTWEQELGLPWENAAAWERISPYNDVAKITTPTLWMGGSDDWNVPILRTNVFGYETIGKRNAISGIS